MQLNNRKQLETSTNIDSKSCFNETSI